jgi:hypothetical protein
MVIALAIALVLLGAALFAILFIEDAYYRRHPEKDRPEPSMWP